jgi:hypothetical protein
LGFFDIFHRSPAQKAEKLKAKLSQKYGDPTIRQSAIVALGELHVPEAVEVLLTRFSFSVEPQSRDTEEKEEVFNMLCERGEEAVELAQAFLKRYEVGTSWALRVLESVLPEEDTIAFACDFLDKLSRTYSRSFEKKLVLLQYVADKQHPAIASVAVPYLEDMTDDVKINALIVLGKHPAEEASVPSSSCFWPLPPPNAYRRMPSKPSIPPGFLCRATARRWRPSFNPPGTSTAPVSSAASTKEPPKKKTDVFPPLPCPKVS